VRVMAGNCNLVTSKCVGQQAVKRCLPLKWEKIVGEIV
jgi:hypothetical protein